MPSTIHELLDEMAVRVPDKTAIVADEGTVTYRALAERSRRLATWLRRSGVRRGDRIAIVLPNGIPAVIALLATSRLAAIFFIVNPAIKWYGLRHILEDAAPALIVTTRQRDDVDEIGAHGAALLLEDGWAEALESEPVALPFPGISSDPACLIYTSGSTGKPKGVISSHRNVVFATWAIQQCLGVQESDVIGNFLPLSFDVGLYQIFLGFQAGATLALGRDAHAGPRLLSKLCEWNVTGLPAVPSLISTVIRLAKRTPGQLPRLRFVTNTGAHLPRAYVADLRALFPTCSVFVMFGLTECKRVSILPPADYARKSESVGRPLPGTECLIVGPDGRALPPDEVGELVVRGPHVMLGYWRAPELTAKRFRTWGAGSEIVLFTGDTCSMDAEGYLYFHGRSDDIYKQGGYRTSALEVEAAACDIPGVRQTALVPPDAETGAILFVTGDITAETVLDGLRRRLEDYKLPAQIVVLDELPLTPNGKIDKRQLKTYLTEVG
jgi:amino acid adenylation domain-containing protein